MKTNDILSQIEHYTHKHRTAKTDADKELTLSILQEQFYELGRKSVGGRPPWNKLDPNCPYDLGMKQCAMVEALQHVNGVTP